MDIQQFERELARDGFGPAIAGDYHPGQFNAPHTHPFTVRGLVVGGNMWIAADGERRDFRTGDVFVMRIGQTHIEEAGADGVRYLYGCKSAQT